MKIPKRPSSKAVAKLAKVSVSTVLKTFQNSSLITEKTKQKVFAAAKKIHYYPNALARSFVSRQSKRIALLVASLHYERYLQTALLCREKLALHGYSGVIEIGASSPFEATVLDRLLCNEYDALITFSLLGMGKPEIEEKIKICQMKGINILSATIFPILNYSRIYPDNQISFDLLVQHLIQRGTENIYFMFELSPWEAEYMKPLKKKIEWSTLSSNPDSLKKPQFQGEVDSEIATWLTPIKSLREKQKIAVFAGDNFKTQMLIRYLATQKISIGPNPGQVMVVGYDERANGDFAPVQITTTRYPLEQHAELLVQEIIKVLKREPNYKPVSISIPTELFAREST